MTSLLSGTGDDDHTTATCPNGYSMIVCSLAAGSTYQTSDGLTFETNGCRAHARGGKSVKVRMILLK